MNASRIVFDYVKASKRIRDLRTGREISHETLAKAIKVSSQSLKDYEQAALSNGTTGKDRATKIAGMSVNTLYALARYFSVSTDYLLGIIDEPNINFDERQAVKSTGLSGEAVRQLSILSAPERLGGDWTILQVINALIEALGDKTASCYALSDIADYFNVPSITSQDFTADAQNRIEMANLNSDVMAQISTKAFEAPVLQELAKSLQYIKENYWNKG